MSRPPERRLVVPDFTNHSKPLADRLRSFANTLMDTATANANEPRLYQPAIDTILKIGKQLGDWGDDTPLDDKPKSAEAVSTEGFD